MAVTVQQLIDYLQQFEPFEKVVLDFTDDFLESDGPAVSLVVAMDQLEDEHE